MFSVLKNKFFAFLKQGISVRKLSLAVAVGFCLGTIPLLGATSILCFFASLLLGINLPAIQAVNYLIYPLQLLLYIPFLKTGAYLFSTQKFDYTLKQIVDMLSTNMWGTISDLFVVNMWAILLWLLFTPFLFSLTYFLSKRVFSKMQLLLEKRNGG